MRETGQALVLGDAMIPPLDKSSLITVFGGSGFVGRYVVRALARRGFRIRAAVRRPDLAGHLQPMGAVGQIHAVQANVRFPESVAAAVEGADGVVNLVAILAEGGEQTFDAIHVEGARAVAHAAHAAGASTLVHVSAIGADPASQSAYARTKAAGEAAILEEFSDAAIMRPSIIFGPEDEFFNRFAAMAQTSPVLPAVGGGRTKFQPVYVGDVAQAIAGVFDGRADAAATYELGGPEVFTFRQLLERVNSYTGRNRRIVTLPYWLAKLQAFVTSPLPNALRPITLDQVRLLQTDNVVSEQARETGHTLAALGVTPPKAIETVVPAYLERFNPKGQYAHYRS